MMDCAKASEHLHSYIDDALSAATRRELEAHLQNCPDCAAQLNALRSLSKGLRALPEEELPSGFNQKLHEALAAEPAPPRPALFQRTWVRAACAAAGLVIVIGAISLAQGALNPRWMLSGGGAPAAPAPAPAAAPSEIRMNQQFAGEINLYESAAPVEPQTALTPASDTIVMEPGNSDMYNFSAADGNAGLEKARLEESGLTTTAGDNASQMERKIIKDANLSLKVADFSAAYQRINEMAARYGGYVVSSDAYSYDGQTMQRGFVMLRVDANRLEEALAEIESLGQLENRNVYTQDVTMTYYDIEGRLGQYRLQEERLMDILREADTVQDLISLESELTRVRAELESLNGQLRYYDQMTALSSINVNLYQPEADTQTVQLSGWPGFLQDIREGFISGVNALIRNASALVVGFFRLLPALILLAVLAAVIVVLVRRIRR